MCELLDNVQVAFCGSPSHARRFFLGTLQPAVEFQGDSPDDLNPGKCPKCYRYFEVAVINNRDWYLGQRNNSTSGSSISFCDVPARLRAPVFELKVTRADAPGVQVENFQFRFITMK